MKIGFTGTQNGMTEAQKLEVWNILALALPDEIHHGDCIGADAKFHEIGVELEIPAVIHPPTDPRKRAFCKPGQLRPEKPYLDRNQDIVDEKHVLIATPKGATEELRSGTWSTIRRARKSQRWIYIVEPTGHVRFEEGV